MAWARVRTWAGVLALAIVTAGCASGPPATDIAAFGAAAKQTTDLFRDAPVLGEELSAAIAEENAALAYLRGGEIALPPAGGPLDDTTEWRAVWAPKLELLAAIGAYADALAKAADPGGAEKVGSAASALTVAVADLAKVEAGKEAGGVASSLGKITIRAWSAATIRDAMAEVQPYLVEASRLLGDDAAVATRLYHSYLRVWAIKRREILRLVRAGSSRSQQYAAYAEAVRDARELRARVVVLERAGEVVARLAAAHQKLLDDKTDVVASIVELKELAMQLRALGGALSGG